jgi:hypothetical protein
VRVAAVDSSRLNPSQFGYLVRRREGAVAFRGGVLDQAVRVLGGVFHVDVHHSRIHAPAHTIKKILKKR